MSFESESYELLLVEKNIDHCILLFITLRLLKTALWKAGTESIGCIRSYICLSPDGVWPKVMTDISKLRSYETPSNTMYNVLLERV